MTLRHRQRDIKQKVRTPTPMKPTKMGGDEDEDVEVEVAADADAAAELLVEDMVTVGIVSEVDLGLPKFLRSQTFMDV